MANTNDNVNSQTQTGEVPGVNVPLEDSNSQVNKEQNDNSVDKAVTQSKQINTEESIAYKDAKDEGHGNPSDAIPSIRKFDKGRANKYIGTTANARNNRYDTMLKMESLSTNDYDDVKISQQAKEVSYSGIEASYSHDGTKNIDNKYQTISDGVNGDLDPVVERSLIATETQTNKTVTYGDDMARSREVGRIFFDKGLVPFRTCHNHIVASKGWSKDCPEVIIKAGNQRFALFNELGPKGKLTGNYVMIQMGEFILKGINPLPAMQYTQNTISKVLVGYVERDSDQGTVRVPVYMYANHLFNVLEVTSTVEDIVAATKNLISLTTNVANRDEMIKISNVANALDVLVESSTDIKDAIKNNADFIPEANRSSIYSVSRRDLGTDISIDNVKYTSVDTSCYNDTESLIYAFDRLHSSEVMMVAIMDNVDLRNMKDAMLFFKGQQGKASHSKFFDSNLGMNFHLESSYFNFPSGLSYARQNQDLWNDESKFFGRFNSYFKNLNHELNELKESKIAVEYLNEITIIQDSISDLLSAFEIGRLSNDVSSSSDLIKRTEEAKIIFGFNPNNLIGFDNTDWNASLSIPKRATFIANPGDIKMKVGKNIVSNTNYLYIPKFYPVAGYGVAASNDNETPDSKVYKIIPKWEEMIINALSDNTFMRDNLFHSTSSGAINPRAAGLYFVNMDADGELTRQEGKDYYPFVWSHQKISWLDIFLLKAMLAKNNSAIRKFSYDTTNGLDRWRRFAQGVDLYTNICQDDPRISLLDLFNKISNNDALYYNPDHRDTDDFNVLRNKSWVEDPFRKPIGTVSDVTIIKEEDISNQTLVMFAAHKYDRNINNLKGYTDFKFMGDDILDDVDIEGNPKHKYSDITDVLWAVQSGEAKLLSLNANTSILTDKDDKVIIFKRCADNDAKIRLELTTEGADNSILGYEAFDEVNKLFSKDDHYYTSLYDGFVLLLTKHDNLRNESLITRSADSGVDGVNMYEASKWLQYTAQMCGIIHYDHPSGTRESRLEKGTRVEASYSALAPYILFKANSESPSSLYDIDHNILYKSSDIDDDSEIKYYPRNFFNGDLTNGTVIKTIEIPNPDKEGEMIEQQIATVSNLENVEVYESKFVGKSTIPSMISGRGILFPRLVATYLDTSAKFHNGFGWGDSGFNNTVYPSSEASLKVDTTEPGSYRIVTDVTNKDNILKLQDGMILGFPFRLEAFVPLDVVTGSTRDGAYGNKESYDSKRDFKAQFGLSQVDSNDRRFFDRTYYLSNDLNRIFASNKDDYARFADILKFCKYCASPVIAACDDRITYNIEVMAKSYSPSKKTLNYDATKLSYLQPLYTMEDQHRFEDFKYKHGIPSRLGLFPEGILISSETDSFGFNAKLPILYYENNKYEDSLMYTRNYINDFIDVRFGNSLIKCQEDWELSSDRSRFFYNRHINKNSL